MRWLLALLFIPSSAFAVIDFESLAYDLEVARYFDQKLHERFPVTYSNLLSTGYFVTPSSRMTLDGEIGLGVAHTPPYLNWNARVQPFPRLELSVNYRIFKKVKDEGLSRFGFGDYADRGANFKIALLTPEESMNQMPGFAFGIEDFMGSQKFTTYFFVATQVWTKLGLETSLGWGAGRYTLGPSRGFFGGGNWFPFWRSCNRWFRGLGVCAEYDPIDYTNPEREPHADGRVTHSPINFGARYNYEGILDLAVGQIRGDAFTALGSLNFNWGRTEGFFPKSKNPPLYNSCKRPEVIMEEEMESSFDCQGFKILGLSVEENHLWLCVINCRYIHEHQMRRRLQYLLASLLPSDIDKVTVVISSYGIPCQQYTYTNTLLQRYVNCHISPYEFDVLTPRENVSQRNIYYKRHKFCKAAIYPDYAAFIGNRFGKYKYAAGVNLFTEGYIPGRIFYEAQASYSFASTM